MRDITYKPIYNELFIPLTAWSKIYSTIKTINYLADFILINQGLAAEVFIEQNSTRQPPES